MQNNTNVLAQSQNVPTENPKASHNPKPRSLLYFKLRGGELLQQCQCFLCFYIHIYLICCLSLCNKVVTVTN